MQLNQQTFLFSNGHSEDYSKSQTYTQKKCSRTEFTQEGCIAEAFCDCTIHMNRACRNSCRCSRNNSI
ncbi:hypothetical protein GDO78_020619 [Eleutherodactylus coqui]|uniref:Uncharacterized protein n=1 Tax=Eleutherodactylus coqui TaxID=57060 RepID=A0A8J6AYU0_ELECQ|nr:hypothetical protein GDO78_020619 [Eleutherodactylus coqui]